MHHTLAMVCLTELSYMHHIMWLPFVGRQEGQMVIQMEYSQCHNCRHSSHVWVQVVWRCRCRCWVDNFQLSFRIHINTGDLCEWWGCERWCWSGMIRGGGSAGTAIATATDDDGNGRVLRMMMMAHHCYHQWYHPWMMMASQ